MDIHYFNGGIKVAHCGRFTSSALDTILNFVRNFPFGGKYVYSSGIIGCRPSFSGIPANDQQPVANLLTEIANWVRETPDEFVFVYFDGDKELLKNNQVGSLIEQIKNIFGDIGIFRPSDKSVCPVINLMYRQQFILTFFSSRILKPGLVRKNY